MKGSEAMEWEDLLDFGNFIDGKWSRSGVPDARKALLGGASIGVAHLATPENVERSILAAGKAFSVSRSEPAYVRAQVLGGIVDGLRRDKESFARLMALEVGKPVKLGRIEVERAILTFTEAQEESKRLRGEWLPLDLEPSARGRSALVRRVPIGVISAITPFNFPLNLVAHKLAPALACGNAVVLKPAPQAPLTAMKLAALAMEAGLPPGRLNCLHLEASKAAPLVEDERVAMLSFTGSASVGWALKAKAGKKRVALELGGSACAIVHRDADLAWAAARCAAGGFAYAGQSCISVQRILVHRTVLDAFLEAFLERVGRLKVGDPLDEEVDLGPMISEAEARRAESWVERARVAGAKVLCGGLREGAWLRPTVLLDVPADQDVLCEEVFAPVVSVEAFDGLEEAVAKANASRFGLQAGLFTRNIEAVFGVFDALEVGGLVLNDAPTWRADTMPYGGVKNSGQGREGVRYAIEEMTERKVMVLAMGGDGGGLKDDHTKKEES